MCSSKQAYQRYVKRLRYKAKGILNFRCVRCFTKHNLEFAHREPTKLSGMSRGQRQRYRDVIDHPASYMLLCREHHLAHDQGFDNTYYWYKWPVQLKIS